MQTSVASRGSSLLGMLRRHLMMRSSSGVACVGFIFLGMCLSVSSVRGDVALNDHFVAAPLTSGWSCTDVTDNGNVTQSGTKVTVSETAAAGAGVRVAIRQTTGTVDVAAHDLRTVMQTVTFGGPMTLTDYTPGNGKTGALYFRMILTGQSLGYWIHAASGVIYAEIEQSSPTSSIFRIIYRNKGGVSVTVFSTTLAISVNDGDRLTVTYTNDDVSLLFYDASTNARHQLADKCGHGFEFDTSNFPAKGYTVLELGCTAGVDVGDAGSAVWDRIDVTKTVVGSNEYFLDDDFTADPLTNGWTLYDGYLSSPGTITPNGSLVTFSETADTTKNIRLAMRKTGSLMDMTTQHLKAITQKLTFGGPMTLTSSVAGNNPIVYLALTGQNTGYWNPSSASVFYTGVHVQSNGTANFSLNTRVAGVTNVTTLVTKNLSLVPAAGDELIVTIEPDNVTATFFDASSGDTLVIADHVRHTLAFNTTNFPDKASTVVDMTTSKVPAVGDMGTAIFDRVRVTKDLGFPASGILISPNPGLLQDDSGYGYPCSTDVYKDVLDEAARHGHDTVVLGLSNGVVCVFGTLDMGAGNSSPTTSFTKAQLVDLIAYARAQRIEPILGVNVLGKTFPVISGIDGTARTDLGTGLAKALPGLFYKQANNQYSNVLDPYYTYTAADGSTKTVYTGILFPMIDELLGLYGTTSPPRYFVFLTDEFWELDVMAVQYAQPRGKTLPQMYGEFLNIAGGHLIAKGITPMIYGDTLLSGRLAQTGHGVTGFTADPRFVSESPSSLYADYISTATPPNSLLTSVNFIDPAVKSQMIVCDWHYQNMPKGEFPSVDYFKTLNFKDVWGLTWWEMKTTKAFAGYNAALNTGGMLATMWEYEDVMPGRKDLSRVLTNSQTYFRNPAYTPPTATFPLTLTDQSGQVATRKYGTTTVFVGAPSALTVSADVPTGFIPGPAQLVIWPNYDTTSPQYEYAGVTGRAFPDKQVIAPLVRNALNLDGQLALAIPATRPTFYDVDLQVLTPDGKYMLGEVRSLDLVFDQQFPLSVGTSNLTTTWLDINIPAMTVLPAYWNVNGTGPYVDATFSQIQPSWARTVYWGVDGPYGGLLYHRVLRAGQSDYVTYARLAQALWDRITNDGMTLQVDFRYDGRSAIPADPWCTMVSHGTWVQGFRVIFNQNTKKISFQIARTLDGGSPVWLYSDVVIQPGQSARVTLKLSSPDANGNRTAQLAVVNQTTGATETFKTSSVTLPLVEAPGYPLGIGSEFHLNQPYKTGIAVLYPQFPGEITKVTILPYP